MDRSGNTPAGAVVDPIRGSSLLANPKNRRFYPGPERLRPDPGDPRVERGTNTGSRTLRSSSCRAISVDQQHCDRAAQLA